MANIYNIRKDWIQAVNYADIALELNPDNVVAIIARSIALMATGKRKEADQLFEEKEKLFKDDYQKACVSAVKRDKKDMLKYLAKAIKDNSHNKVTVLFDPDFTPYSRPPLTGQIPWRDGPGLINI